ncbi:MAG: hypothetical protein RLZZ174_1776 [Pseudomonadota bacterium]
MAKLFPPTVAGLALLALGLGSPESLAQAEKDEARAPLYWVAPMDPNYRRPGPGKSPMGMDLIPVYEAPASTLGVQVSAERREAFGVRVAPIDAGPLKDTLRGSAVLSLPEDQRTRLVLREDGWITARHIPSEGTRVVQGEPLLSIDVPAWAQDQEAWLDADHRGDAPLRTAAAQRLRRTGFPAEALEALRTLKQLQNPIVLRAPHNGIVEALSLTSGAFVAAGTPMMTVAQDDALWVELYFSPTAQDPIHPGAAVRVAFPQADPLPLNLSWVDGQAETGSRRLHARAVVGRPLAESQGLRPGAVGEATLQWESQASVTRVPLSAVLRGVDGAPDQVLKAVGADRFVPVPIHLGRRGAAFAEVHHGLQPGDRVVVQGTFLLETEANRAAELARLNAGDDHSTMDHSTMDHSTMDHSSMDHSGGDQ